MIRNIVVVLVMLAACCTGAHAADRATAHDVGLVHFADAEKILFPAKDVKEGWGRHQIRRGGTFHFYGSTTEYNMDGDALWSNWFQYSRNLSGTVIAVPIGDFRVEQAFVYQNPASRHSCLTGAVVSVEVQLSTGATTPTEMVMHNTVKNLASIGMALADTNGGKPARIMALKKSACRRFGGKNPRVHYNAVAGKVYIMLEDCRPEQADATFVPATPEGAAKSEREKLAKLTRDEDRGGTTIWYVRTEIHPVGSPHLHDRIP